MDFDVRLAQDPTGPWTGICERVNAVTQARTLRGALDHLRSAVALAVDGKEADIDFGRIDVVFADGTDASPLLAEALEARRLLTEVEARAGELTREVIRILTEAGLPRRDVGEVLGLSGQRITQLLDA